MMDLDYKVLKYLYRSQKPMKIGTIAKDLGIKHSTLGSCISKRLRTKGYVNYEAYREVELTQRGKNLAIELVRHTQLLEVLLYNALGLSKEEAREESEKFNLLFSCNTINIICEKFGHPTRCPCGELILNSSECYCEEEL